MTISHMFNTTPATGALGVLMYALRPKAFFAVGQCGYRT